MIPRDQFSFQSMSVLRLAGHEIMDVLDDPFVDRPFCIRANPLLTKRQAAAIASAIIRVLVDECNSARYSEMIKTSEALADYAVSHYSPEEEQEKAFQQ